MNTEKRKSQGSIALKNENFKNFSSLEKFFKKHKHGFPYRIFLLSSKIYIDFFLSKRRQK